MTLTAVQMATIAAIGSALVPLAVSFLKREHWSAGVKQLLAFLVSALVACAGIAVATPHWSTLTVASLVGLSYTGSQLVYQTYFRGSAFDTVLTGLFSQPAPGTSSGGPGSVVVTPSRIATALAETFVPSVPKPPAPAPTPARAPVSEAPTGPDGRPYPAR